VSQRGGYPAAVPEAFVHPRRRDRMRRGLRQPASWWQLARFTAVGASGYVVNLAIFALCFHLLELDYRLAAVAAFVVALANNFWWNRHWTFDARHGHAGHQAARFVAVSLVAFAVSLVILQGLVDGAGVAEVVAQAVAVAAVTPVNFLGNKLWTFGD
jgi:putative flippase GtrA